MKNAPEHLAETLPNSHTECTGTLEVIRVRAYSVDLRERVVAAVQSGRSVAEVARLFGVSRRSIGRYRRQATTGDLTPRHPPGHRRHIPVEHEDQLLAQLRAHDTATLERHCALWAKTTGVRVSATTMYRTSKRLGWTWKKKRWWPPSGTRTHGSRGGR